MSMGRKKTGQQQSIWIDSDTLVRVEAQAFYRGLNGLLSRHGFDAFVEELIEKSEVFKDGGRPSIAPGVYFRMLLIGYFEGLTAERAIAWKCEDSLSLREFLGFSLTQATPDHSTLSGLRRRLPEEIHREVFDWVLSVAQDEGVLSGRKVAVDSTTLEANAAMRKIVRRVDGVTYQKYLKKLAKAEGIKDPQPKDLARMDRKRKGKKVSNKDWKSATDKDSRIAKMKDGTTHLAYKAENAVDLKSGIIVAAEIHPADRGDRATIVATLDSADAAVIKAGVELGVAEAVADCGYHGEAPLLELQEKCYRTCIAEPKMKKRNWRRRIRDLGDKTARARQAALYLNRARVKSAMGVRLQRKRAEIPERSFAHVCESGGMRRVHVRGRGNVQKRYGIQAAAANLGIVMRKLCGFGTPRSLQGRLTAAFDAFVAFLIAVWHLLIGSETHETNFIECVADFDAAAIMCV